LTAEWWDKYNLLNAYQLEKLQAIVAMNLFDEDTITTGDPAVEDVLKYYQVRRNPK
jgi:hypothetical protein